ncbi:hypothetical protein [Polaribacter sp.]|uniref:hypothetical protein n=1 Tax=Polaribacter sp. TaxID=1920175 RepID=UPI003F6A845E
MKKILIHTLILFVFTSCFGDKKSGITTNFNDTSFENKSFQTKVTLSEIPSPCSLINKNQLAELYNVADENIIIIKGNIKNKQCSFGVKISEDKFGYLTGGINFYEDKDKLADGATWIESWQIQKGVSKSAEWIPNYGKAALWIGKKRELRVKLKDYTMSLYIPGSPFNKQELAYKRDYKKIALAIVKQIDFLN